jgi:hypothetical protein
MANEKKPTVETVQSSVKVSDLLLLEVCSPLKDQLDNINVCSPHICVPNVEPKECIPDMICKPIKMACLPDMICKPIKMACLPDKVCSPWVCHPVIPEVCTPSAGKPWELDPRIIRERLMEDDYAKLQSEVEKLKSEVAGLRKKIS